MKRLRHIASYTALLILVWMTVSVGQVSVSLQSTSGQIGGSIDVPLTIGSVTGLGVTSFQFVLTYDTAIVKLTGVDGTGTLSSTFATVPNLTVPGQLRVASAGITPIVGSGTLLILKAQLRNLGISGLNFTEFRFNEGSPQASPENGTITVRGANQKPVLISRSPSSPVIAANRPIRFVVNAFDPEGGTLIFTWRLNGAVVQTGTDSSFTRTFAYPPSSQQQLDCLFADLGGMYDSTSWNLVVVGIADGPTAVPAEFALGQNYPNPFNPTTTIQFDLPTISAVTIEVYDLLGIRVCTLANGERLSAGRHLRTWDGRDQNGSAASSGMYLYRLRAGDHVLTRTMLLMK